MKAGLLEEGWDNIESRVEYGELLKSRVACYIRLSSHDFFLNVVNLEWLGKVGLLAKI